MHKQRPSFDIHMHLAGTGCNCSGCWVHPNLLKRVSFRFLKALHGIKDEELTTNIDQNWAKRLADVVSSSKIHYGVALGFDGSYAENGELDPNTSQMLIPAAWVFAVCKLYPHLLPGPSINPFRKDALAVLDYCIENKAVLIKWLPSAQQIDPASPKIKTFYERLAQSGLPLLVHCGGERTFASFNPEYNDVGRLNQALDTGVKVICAHSATKIIFSRERDQIPDLIQLLERYPNLWLDNSGLCNPGRFSQVKRLASHPLIRERTLYGSDWPIPSNSFYFVGDISLRAIRALENIPNPIDRDLATKLSLGYPQDCVFNAEKVLANLPFWTQKTKQAQ